MAGKMDAFKYKKSLGQNFLNDRNILSKIVSSSNIFPNSLIIEVGPGNGALTKELIKTGNYVLAFEIDDRLRSPLELLEKDNENFRIVFADFLKVNANNYINNYKYDKLYVIANIPYYITTPIVTKIIDVINPDVFTIMVQKEVGSRLMASPNTRDYGSLSVYSQFKYNITKICDVSRNSFFPKPDVDSIVLKFEKKLDTSEFTNMDLFFKFVRDAFKHKRKNLKNNLCLYNLNKIETFLKTIGKDLTYRAEQISIDEFVNLYKYLITE